MKKEIRELNERFEEKFEELKSSGARVAGSEKMKKKVSQHWGVNLDYATYDLNKGNLLSDTEKLSTKMKAKTVEKSDYCDLNGQAGVADV
jgi:hypothetical protein